jgi:hypothetical protein
MAHFAKLGSNDVVLEVIVVGNDKLLDENGVESEQKGIEFCRSIFGPMTFWKQTSYNGNFRRRFAAVGSYYISEKDIFAAPNPSHEDYILDRETGEWVHKDPDLREILEILYVE